MAKSESFFYGSNTGSTGTLTFASTTSSTAADTVKVWTQVYDENRKTMANVEKAVFAHIQAVRTLGRNRINTEEIAEALSLPQAYVIAAIEKLRSKGVRIAE